MSLEVGCWQIKSSLKEECNSMQNYVKLHISIQQFCSKESGVRASSDEQHFVVAMGRSGVEVVSDAAH